MERALAELLSGFVRPLVVGGVVRVGRPISAVVLPAWAARLEAESEALVAIDDARQAAAARLVLRPRALLFGGDELRVVVALHDGLLAAHPELGRSGRARLAAAALAVADGLGAPDARAILARHTLVARLFALRRRDVRVTWWTGKARFAGQRPPRRLLVLPGLRRVRSEESEAGPDEILAACPSLAWLERLLVASPATALLAGARRLPAFSWTAAAAALRDAELARLAADEWIAPARALTGPGESPARVRLALAAPGAGALALPTAGGAARLAAVFLLAQLGRLADAFPAETIAALAAAAVTAEAKAGEARPARALLALPEAAARAGLDLGARLPPAAAASFAVLRAAGAKDEEALAPLLAALSGGSR